MTVTSELSVLLVSVGTATFTCECDELLTVDGTVTTSRFCDDSLDLVGTNGLLMEALSNAAVIELSVVAVTVNGAGGCCGFGCDWAVSC